MDAPELAVFVDAREWTRIRAPAPIAPRDWILGVVAIQLSVEGRRVKALLRANVTGAEPQTRELDSSSVVQVALVEPGRELALPRIARLAKSGAAAVALHLGDSLLDAIALDPARLDEVPPTRAFGHVFCRFLRSGATEPGFDLTDFLSLPPGAKYQRRVSRALAVGEVVSYAIEV